MTMKKFNVNSFMKVKLTDRGKDVYYHRWDELNKFYGKEVIKPEYPKMDEDGFSTFQWWEFMNIFGPFMENGMDIVIEKNYVYIDEKYLEDCDDK